LREVFVGTENSDSETFFTQVCCQGADDVVSLKAIAGKIGNAGGATKVPAVFKLAF